MEPSNSNTPINVFIIAISGGSCSGKTTLAKSLYQKIGPENSVIISQDDYYLDQSDKFDKDGGNINFDHPDSIDFKLLATHLMLLKSKKMIQSPIYDFETHKRSVQLKTILPKKLIIVDGTLVLSIEYLRDLFDMKVFMDIDESIRFERRIKRDVHERGRTKEGVEEQFIKHVRPMHDQFVGPSKIFADISYTDNQKSQELLEIIQKKFLK